MGNDVVKNPKHYTEGRKFQPKDVIRDWKLNFNLGNAVKYIARAGRKDDIVQDLKKAQEYIQFEIDAIEAERSHEPEEIDREVLFHSVHYGDLKPVQEKECESIMVFIEVPEGVDKAKICKLIEKRFMEVN